MPCSTSPIWRPPSISGVPVRPPEGEELRLCAEASALAKPYALMIVQGATRIAPEQLGDKARAAYEAWRAAAQG